MSCFVGDPGTIRGVNTAQIRKQAAKFFGVRNELQIVFAETRGTSKRDPTKALKTREDTAQVPMGLTLTKRVQATSHVALLGPN